MNESLIFLCVPIEHKTQNYFYWQSTQPNTAKITNILKKKNTETKSDTNNAKT